MAIKARITAPNCSIIAVLKFAIREMKDLHVEDPGECRNILDHVYSELKHTDVNEIPCERFSEYCDVKAEVYKLAFTKFKIKVV